MVFSGGRFCDHTALFRYTPLFKLIARNLENAPPNLKIGNFPDSVGSQSISLSCIFDEHGLFNNGKNPVIHGADISPRKIKAARTGVQPKAFWFDVPEEYKKYFRKDKSSLWVDPDILSRIEFLDPVDLTQSTPSDFKYYATLCLNLLVYLPDDKTKRALLEQFTSYTTHMICLNYGTDKIGREDMVLSRAVMADAGFYPDPLFNDADVWSADIFFKEP